MQAVAKVPIVQAARQLGASGDWIDTQLPVAGPQQLAEIDRARRGERDIGLVAEAGLPRAAFQHHGGVVGAHMVHLRLVRPPAGQVEHLLDRFVNVDTAAERMGYVDAAACTAMAECGVPREQAGFGVCGKCDFGGERAIGAVQCDCQRIGIRLTPIGKLPNDRLALAAERDPREAEVQAREGQWYLMRILPYRTLENVIEGAVVSFVEITKQKELQEQLQDLARIARKAQDYAENVVDTIHEPLLVLSADLKVVSANSSFYKFFHVAPEEAIGRSLYDLGNNQWNIPELRKLLEQILPQETSFKGFQVTCDFQSIGRHTMIMNARQIPQKTGTDRLILLAMEDVTVP